MTPADAGAVTACVAEPESDQPAKRYCTPAAPDCVAAAIVWLLPGVHWKEQGDVHGVLSTLSERPLGAAVTVTATVAAANTAVTEAGALSVKFCGVVTPERAPEKPLNV